MIPRFIEHLIIAMTFAIMIATPVVVLFAFIQQL